MDTVLDNNSNSVTQQSESFFSTKDLNIFLLTWDSKLKKQTMSDFGKLC